MPRKGRPQRVTEENVSRSAKAGQDCNAVPSRPAGEEA
uniref:Uncharacterized protein n=1 Tax=Siphoviridae sp. ctW4q29 TaxID=2825535 RepID=A0A8S5TRX6_9CAUD|nr:MAG TPA: hypothetical protein [Siphoviridae sp. ctW4q29]